jgi:hypothetical protein
MRAARFLRNYAPHAVAAIGPILVAIGALALSTPNMLSKARSPWGMVFLGGILCQICGVIWLLKRQSEISGLQRKIDDLERSNRDYEDRRETRENDYFQRVRQKLIDFYKDILRLGPDERISLFRVHGRLLILESRYSEHQGFKTREEQVYEIGQGCIGRTWERGGIVVVENLPDPETEPRAYVEVHLHEWNLPETKVKYFTMPVRSLMATRILDDRRNVGNNEQEGWVLSIESVKPRMPNKRRVKEFLQSTDLDRFSRFLEWVAPFRPRPRLADDEEL